MVFVCAGQMGTAARAVIHSLMLLKCRADCMLKRLRCDNRSLIPAKLFADTKWLPCRWSCVQFYTVSLSVPFPQQITQQLEGICLHVVGMVLHQHILGMWNVVQVLF